MKNVWNMLGALWYYGILPCLPHPKICVWLFGYGGVVTWYHSWYARQEVKRIRWLKRELMRLDSDFALQERLLALTNTRREVDKHGFDGLSREYPDWLP